MIKILDLNFLGINRAIASFLVETSEGPILFETGPYSTFPHLVEQVKNAGHAPTDIKHVFLTHIHFDHAGAAWAFAKQGAKIYVHPFGEKHLANPEKLWNSAKQIYKNDMERLWGDMQPIPEDQLTAVEHESEVTIGNTKIKAWHTPGHAVHHIAWQLDDIIFTGDVAGVRVNPEDQVVEPPCPPPDINVEDWLDSIRTIRTLSPQALYLTHFGKIEDISWHLDELEKRLIEWSNWIKTKMELGKNAEETVPEFKAFVANQLSEMGVGEKAIRQYEAANPSYMSVAGLMRYWKKKKEREQA
ncbi:glyoxylase-like metal-dependent hydrolase (beta-lactamase superfamily II) [Catalinimonas alkaloidigena]|uniref:MBL fold metallo-hydrolase n=1 Tax=Catalinimonas alkaloidigena TaxID=1075417 RepID=UPI0024076DF4|nr:MBL fold metallo-hydrolase [Catalinimonas alkaloidigena]MDF9795843.1 glyoxylase-like metal-dependent hydrolase (beta-lactamase superfamily II) [Catalinimonas alkaloidigena]